MPRTLSSRIVALFLTLLLCVQAASFFAIRGSIDRNARKSISGDLVVGERVLNRLLLQNANKLTEAASLLATDYGFRDAVASNDAETIASVLSNHGERIGATVAALLDTDFKLRAAATADGGELGPVIARLAVAAQKKQQARTIAMVRKQPYELVLVPMKAPVTVGWVLMGFPLDRHLADDMRQLSSLHLTLLVDTPKGWVADITTLSPPVAVELGSRLEGILEVAENTDHTLTLSDGEYGAHTVLLSNGADGTVVAALMRSVDEAVAPYRQLQLGLIGLTLLGAAIFALVSVVAARRITTPVRALVLAADRLGRGDYDEPMQGQQRTDELGDLAKAFEHMRIRVSEKQQEVLRLAYWDALTNLPNRLQFRDTVHAAIVDAQQRPGGRKLAVIMLDLDRFKHVNDVLGYRFGDMLLVKVGERLAQQTVRGGDLVARMSGDEFAVLLYDADVELAQTVAQRVATAFETSLTLEDQTVDMGAGIGMACFPQHATDADSLLSRAEVAMYAAKRRSNGPLLYNPTIDSGSSQTLSLLSELRHAVDTGELRLFLQPKISLNGSRVVGAEALVRWQHPLRGLVPPMQFIPFAEQTGFIRTMTVWVFEEAARTWLRLSKDGLHLSLSVNLSTRDLLDQDLPTKFDTLLARLGVPAEAFCLEITESAIMDDPVRALLTLERLSGLGFRLSIDDFGTGYSSLAYLKRLPVDELKIDQSFVRNMESDVDDAKIVRSTIDLAHNLGLTVVAEGVETIGAWGMLQDLACDEAQGYYMGRPMPSNDFTAWAAGWVSRQQNEGARIVQTVH